MVDHTEQDAVARETLRVLTEHGAMRHAQEYAHAAACVRFVAALDAGEILGVMRFHDGSLAVYPKMFINDLSAVSIAPTALAAFRAAQEDR